MNYALEREKFEIRKKLHEALTTMENESARNEAEKKKMIEQMKNMHRLVVEKDSELIATKSQLASVQPRRPYWKD